MSWSHRRTASTCSATSCSASCSQVRWPVWPAACSHSGHRSSPTRTSPRRPASTRHSSSSSWLSSVVSATAPALSPLPRSSRWSTRCSRASRTTPDGWTSTPTTRPTSPTSSARACCCRRSSSTPVVWGRCCDRSRSGSQGIVSRCTTSTVMQPRLLWPEVVMSVLEVRDLTIRFGGLTAIDGLNLSVNEWEIVGLMGPNGAGKTTAFNCITGFYKANNGHVIYRGEDVTDLPPHRKAALGIGRTFQNVGMVKSETVLENLLTAQHLKAGYGALTGLTGVGVVRQREKDLAAHADAILELLGLTAFRNRPLGSLSYGTLKLLELGCVLATDPDLLLLDEPSSGMGPEEAHELGERLLALRQEFGLTMLLIEHHVPLVLSVCDHVYVLNFGRLLAEGPPSVIQTHPEVVAAYLGGEAPDALEATAETDEDAALDAQLTHTEP